MNKYIVLIVFFISPFVVSQNNDDIYIYIENQNFFGHKGNYSVSLSIESDNKEFKNDIYNFNISDYSLNERNIWELGEKIKDKKMPDTIPKKFFNNKHSCDIHEWLSKVSKEKSLYIITKTPSSIKGGSLKNQYVYWKADYAGTIKDVVPTQLGRGPFYTGR